MIPYSRTHPDLQQSVSFLHYVMFELPLPFLLRYLAKILHTPFLLSISFLMPPVQEKEAPVSQSDCTMIVLVVPIQMAPIGYANESKLIVY